jgi:hypothetical protein
VKKYNIGEQLLIHLFRKRYVKPKEYFPMLPWLMTRFESRGAHKCEEQGHARDTRVYTSSGLREGKNPTSYVRRCIMIRWVENLSTPSFRSQGGRVYKEDPGQLLLYLTRTLSPLA